MKVVLKLNRGMIIRMQSILTVVSGAYTPRLSRPRHYYRASFSLSDHKYRILEKRDITLRLKWWHKRAHFELRALLKLQEVHDHKLPRIRGAL